jgi:hypothetical protein
MSTFKAARITVSKSIAVFAISDLGALLSALSLSLDVVAQRGIFRGLGAVHRVFDKLILGAHGPAPYKYPRIESSEPNVNFKFGP